jgi:hypothetical protein
MSYSRSPSLAEDGKSWVELAARAGYGAKGTVYGLVGVLAASTALGFGGGRIVGTQSALETLRVQPFGQVMLVAMAAGLAGFVLWRFVQSIFDPENRGDDGPGIARRAGLAISGLTYSGLAFSTVKLLSGGAGGASSSSDESARTVMELPGGLWLVGGFGAAMIGVACYQAYRAWAAPFSKHWKQSQMSRAAVQLGTLVSRFGIAARAISFALIGWFFVQAALRANPEEARGLDGALRAFYQQPYGELWLGAIGFGFVCYGAYCGINAVYKRIDP